jgi:hypothetical protein
VAGLLTDLGVNRIFWNFFSQWGVGMWLVRVTEDLELSYIADIAITVHFHSGGSYSFV